MKKLVSLVAVVLALTAFLTSGLAAEAGPTAKKVSPSGNISSPAANQKQISLGRAKVQKAAEKPQTISIEGDFETATPASSTGEDDIGTFDAVMTAMGGGEDIASATVIGALPYSDAGSTAGAVDDYDEGCVAFPGVSPDHVYSYTPAADELVDVSLCASSYLTHLWIYRNTEDTVHACNRFSTTCGLPRSALFDVEMLVGNTYYIVIDGESGQSGSYIIDVSAIPKPVLADSSALHPAFAEGGTNMLMLGYEDNRFDTALVWFGSTDDGDNFTGGSFTFTGNPTYPSVDYWRSDTMFLGTCVGPATESVGGRTYLTRLNHPTNTASWGQSSWNWNSFGWHDMKMADIAAIGDVPFLQQPGQFRFGILSMVISSTYISGGIPVGNNSPHIFYEIDSSIAGFATISWYNSLTNCQSTTADIDKITKYAYAVYDRYDSTAAEWQLFVRYDWFTDMDVQDSAGGFTYTLDPGENMEYPAVQAHNGDVVIVMEYYTGDPNDRDIICWYNPAQDGKVDNLATSVVISTTDNERYPRLSHISGDRFLCTFHRGDSVLQVESEDGGETWGTPVVVSLVPDDQAYSEYRAVDITEEGSKVIYEYRDPAIFPDTSIFLHFVQNNLIIDTDGDGVEDDFDNCPLVFNPLQEDADADGIGNVCDDCTDTDGDGFGDPGFFANTCPVDNCPSVFNPTQTDADGDLLGDACDPCTDTDSDGFGNPGYAANVCPDDNCPDTLNPLQEDTDNDGIGDACCCIGMRGNTDGIGGEGPDIADLLYMVDYQFAAPPGPPSPCPAEADVDGSGTIDIADLLYMVDYQFGSPPGPAPVACP